MSTPAQTPSTLRLQSQTLQQMQELPARLVLGVEPLEITMRGITDGAVSGTTNDAVLRFDVANDSYVGDASALPSAQLQAVHSAADGDSIVVRAPGVYEVELCFSQAASNEARLGISADVAAGGLTGLPAMATSGMRQVGGALLPASSACYSVLKTTVTVSEAEARTGKTIRAHGTVAAGSVIQDASIAQNLDCYLRVTRRSLLIA